MTDRPRVSVVVPFFGSERTIDACIESLLAQEDPGGPVELILVDNGSRDRSADIAAGYPDLVRLKEPKPGAYAARNAGIRRARGRVVAFTDADCTADPDWLREACAALDEPSTAVVLGHCRYPRTASRALRLLGAYENAKTRYVLERCPPVHHFAYANNMAVRASVFAEIGPFEEWDRAADTELVHRLAASRPDLRVVFRSGMRVTHMEFVEARRRARRLALYTQTNAKIPTFRELRLRHRLGVLRELLRG